MTSGSSIQMTVKRNWNVIDGSTPDRQQAVIPPGTHEMERIPNPYGYACDWLVLKGTQIGGSEGSWRQWEEEGWDDFQVVITEK